MSQVYYLAISYDGKLRVQPYYPDGDGRHYSGYVTNLNQLRRALRDAFGVAQLDLYRVGKYRMHPIRDNTSLKDEVKQLPNGQHTLLLTAFNVPTAPPRRAPGRVRLQHVNVAGVHAPVPVPAYAPAPVPMHVPVAVPVRQDPERTGEFDTVPLLGNLDARGRVQRHERERFHRTSRIELIRRFARHWKQCHYCKRYPILGVRYKFRGEGTYNSCEECHSKLFPSDRKKWHTVLSPWKGDAPRKLVNTDDVRHLQYILTSLGYMEMSDTDRRQGRYGERTRKAVERFQYAQELYRQNTGVYTRETARMLAMVVREHRRRLRREIS